jgi:hypothetical protein
MARLTCRRNVWEKCGVKAITTIFRAIANKMSGQRIIPHGTS